MEINNNINSNENNKAIPKRILGTLLNSVGAGVVPRFGLEYIAIGRKDEIGAITEDLNFVEEGGGAFRFIIGRYGSGKSFLLQLIRAHCLERGFLTADADLSPERKLSGGKMHGLATYRELIKNLASRSSPDGNALVNIISRWLANLQVKLMSEKKLELNSPEFDTEMSKEILSVANELENLVCGFDFAAVILKYYNAYKNGDENLKSNALKWLRGEYTTKTEAKKDLGVNIIIGDENWYDFIKLLAVFAKKINYKGLVIFIDECVNLYKIINRISRENNYEKLLAMFNDCLQGKAESLAIYLGGTPQFLEDNRRGLYSYEALKSRLTEGRYANSKYKNLIGPVIKLERLSDEEIFALALRIYYLHKNYYNYEDCLNENNILDFLKDYMSRVGAENLVTPREIIRDLLAVLNIMRQNPDVNFDEIIAREKVNFKAAENVNEDDVVFDEENEDGESRGEHRSPVNKNNTPENNMTAFDGREDPALTTNNINENKNNDEKEAFVLKFEDLEV